MNWLNDLKNKARAATSGPWKLDNDCSVFSTTSLDSSPEVLNFIGFPIGRTFFSAHYGDQHLKDCDYIAHCNPEFMLAIAEKLEMAEKVLYDSCICDDRGACWACKYLEVFRKDPNA